jgi:hypothetical protein
VAELIAWKNLGGRADDAPAVLTDFTGLSEAFEHLGGGSDLLSIIGSCGDTTDDETILKWLRFYNAGQPVILIRCGDEVHGATVVARQVG